MSTLQESGLHPPPQRRRAPIFLLGALAGGAIVAVGAAVWNGVPVACTTVGYDDLSPIRLELPDGIGPDAEVAACFDLNCVPVAVEADAAGAFAVPQEAPFLGSEPEQFPVGTTGVRVVVSDGGAVVADNRFGIESVSDAPAFSRCPGPFHYGPVAVSGGMPVPRSLD